MNNLFNNFKKNNKIFTIVIVVFFFLISSFIMGINGYSGFAMVLTNLLNYLLNKTYFGSSLLFQIVCILIIIPIIILRKRIVFKKSKINFFSSLLLVWPIIIFLLIKFIGNLKYILVSKISVYEILSLLILVILIGIFEELFFRGWLQNELFEKFGKSKKSIIISIVISSAIFGLVHMCANQNILVKLDRFLVPASFGLVVGSLYYKTKNFWSIIFLHAFWDFVTMFPDINTSSVCVVDTGEFVNSLPLSFLLSTFVMIIPLLITVVMLFIKKDKVLDKDKELKNDELKNSDIKKILNIAVIIYLIIYAFISFKPASELLDVCGKQILKEPENYSEQLFSYTEYNLEINKPTNKDKVVMNGNVTVLGMEYYEYDFKINNNNKLRLNVNDKEYKFDYHNVLNMAIYKTGDTYNIILLTLDQNGNVMVYYSDFLGRYNVDDDKEFVEKFMKSFNQIIVPITIEKIGTYQEDDKTYPLLISSTGERYIYIDGEIHTYKK